MNTRIRAALPIVLLWSSACNRGALDSESIAAAAASSETNKTGAIHSKAARRREGKLRQANEIRLALVVLPGDAHVEIEGQVVERREGLVDIEGKVGDVRRIRAWKGEKALEKTVTISENGLNPAIVDLNSSNPAETTTVARKKSSPVQFGFDE